MTPVSTVDPFSREFLTDPYPFHAALREAGPVVWLERYGIWAMARHEEVRACLMDWETFCSSAGVGLSDFRKETPWRPPSLILEADPPLHTRTRAVLTRILSAAAMKRLWTTFQRDAVELVDRLVERGTFDAVRDLAEVYPLGVFPDAVGLEAEGRENLLPYGNMAFNAFGPRNDLFHQPSAAPCVGVMRFDHVTAQPMLLEGPGDLHVAGDPLHHVRPTVNVQIVAAAYQLPCLV